jgi:hypothetical protein
MNLRPTAHRPARSDALTLVALESLPCGCVSGVYQANSALALELVEAKGPHCVFSEHRLGGVVRLGVVDSTP